ALVKLCSSATAMKYSSWRSSMRKTLVEEIYDAARVVGGLCRGGRGSWSADAGARWAFPVGDPAHRGVCGAGSPKAGGGGASPGAPPPRDAGVCGVAL